MPQDEPVIPVLRLSNLCFIAVNDGLQTSIDNIYAGDVIEPPALASSAMEPERRVSWNKYGINIGDISHTTPTGIYGIS